jgi:small subunit ribosomal protein S20
MAITTSAKKAHRQSLRRKSLNDARREALRGALKAVRLAKKGDKGVLSKAYQAIDKAVKRGLMTKNTAARRKSKLARTLKAGN